LPPRGKACRQHGWRHARPAAYGGGGMLRGRVPAWGMAACHVTTSILPHSILQKPNKTEHKMEPFRSSNFSEPNTGSEPFHALGMEPFHSVLPGSRTEHILNQEMAHVENRENSCNVVLKTGSSFTYTCEDICIKFKDLMRHLAKF
jgi:hypothetical protein